MDGVPRLDKEYIENINLTLDKFLKYVNHLAIEFIRDPSWNAKNDGENYVTRLIDFCYTNGFIDIEERDDFYSWEIELEEISFRILEVLIQNWYFWTHDFWIADSADPSSFVYAWNAYIRLWKAIGKWIIDIPSFYTEPSSPTWEIKQEVHEALSHEKSKSQIKKAETSVEKTFYKPLIKSIIQAFEFDISDIFDRNELINLLKETWMIWKKEETYFRTISLHTDFVFYLMIILDSNDDFWKSISTKDREELDQCFEAFNLFCWESYALDIRETNATLRIIEQLWEKLIQQLLHGRDIDTFWHDDLNDILDLLEEFFSLKPMYMRIIHIEFDELKEIPTTFEKTLNILGILICDILPGDHDLFEYASEVFLVNIRSEKTHRAVKNICNEKLSA